MKFVIDEQLPTSLARWLIEQGHEVHHIHDLGLRSASDRAVHRAARDLGAVIVTKDSDFLTLARTVDAPQVVWLRTGNETTGALIERFAAAFPRILSLLQDREAVVEVR